MNFYLAARFSRKSELCGYADQLCAAGHEVTSRWLGQDAEATYDDLTPDGCRKCAEHDVADVLKADCVISFTEPVGIPNSSRGGRHVEFGIGLATGKRLVIIGPRENVFHWLLDTEIYDTWADFLEWQRHKMLCERKF